MGSEEFASFLLPCEVLFVTVSVGVLADLVSCVSSSVSLGRMSSELSSSAFLISENVKEKRC